MERRGEVRKRREKQEKREGGREREREREREKFLEEEVGQQAHNEWICVNWTKKAQAWTNELHQERWISLDKESSRMSGKSTKRMLSCLEVRYLSLGM